MITEVEVVTMDRSYKYCSMLTKHILLSHDLISRYKNYNFTFKYHAQDINFPPYLKLP